METHAHDLHKAPGTGFKHYFFEFFMLFLAVSAGFIVENLREHHIENERLDVYLKSMELDIESNVYVLDSAIYKNKQMIASYDSVVTQLTKNEPSIDRAAFALQLGEVWYRGFVNRNETFEQMKSSGSLRYVKDFHLLTSILDYQRACNFAQYRTERFEQKYYTDYFLPALYNNYDMQCLHMLDTGYSHNPVVREQQLKHVDVITGEEAKKFRKEVGSAFMLRIERLRVVNLAYEAARRQGEELSKLMKEHLK